MSGLIVPSLDEEPWPTLGPQVCQHIEDLLVFGPGDLRGQPARLDAEKRALIYRMFEVFPRGHPRAGRRRFRRCAIMLRKGTAKTELAAWIAAVELHHEGPVRCDGWRKVGRDSWEPVGRPVVDPYIPMLAYTEEQTEDLAYGALHAILSESAIADDFDIGLERIKRADGKGKAEALSSAPSSRDGARTTFQHKDETHHWDSPRLRQAHTATLANLPKRQAADAWELETTTAYSPGAGSVAESTHDYARAVEAGKVTDSRLFFFYRAASSSWDIKTPEGLHGAVLEASGPVAEWSDIDGIEEQFRAPDADLPYLERVWLGRIVPDTRRAFDADRWKELAKPEHVVPEQALVTLGFDGSQTRDATALVATEVATGHQWPLGIWERDPLLPEEVAWRVPKDEVELELAEAFERYRVWRMLADPAYWGDEIARWAGRWGEDVVVGYWTNRWLMTAKAVRAYSHAIAGGELQHDGDAQLSAHVGNAVRQHVQAWDEDGNRMWVIRKERPDSPHHIDGAMAGVLSWEAHTQAVAKGLLEPPAPSVYASRGIRSIKVRSRR